ncbi:hypothetical protein ElyMa_003739600 [Elysia marginata]|uniref:Uncharacterized protein n=1 Tax=Elysia marginata TaxID=1093978 RepID=A0AAV4F6R5_9GAST|nr:hypothetical protein ElyMa_003739600 [Elysia marginata]
MGASCTQDAGQSKVAIGHGRPIKMSGNGRQSTSALLLPKLRLSTLQKQQGKQVKLILENKSCCYFAQTACPSN